MLGIVGEPSPQFSKDIKMMLVDESTIKSPEGLKLGLEASNDMLLSLSRQDDETETSLTSFFEESANQSVNSFFSNNNGHIHNEYFHETEDGNSSSTGYSFVISTCRRRGNTPRDEYVHRRSRVTKPEKRKPFCSVVRGGEYYPRCIPQGHNIHTTSDWASERDKEARIVQGRRRTPSKKNRLKSILDKSIHSNLKSNNRHDINAKQDRHGRNSETPFYRRLYTKTSLKKQSEGKRRCEELRRKSVENKLKRNGEWNKNKKKISASRASELYYRGMMQKIRLESMAARNKNGTHFETKLDLNQMLEYYDILKKRVVNDDDSVHPIKV